MIYSVSPALYEETVARLTEAVGSGSYFSGLVVFPFAGTECRLTTSVVVYRERRSQPEGSSDDIADLVPVWWEFHTTGDEGECPNDFSFAELRLYLR